jgi:uncharacterized protein (TIGR02246 family)
MGFRFASYSFAVLILAGSAGVSFAQTAPHLPAEIPVDSLQPVESPEVAAAPATPAVPEAVASASEADVAAIRSASLAFVDAFNAADAKAVAAAWTADGAYVDEAGQTFENREAIEKEYAAFFEATPGARLRLFVDSVRLLSDSAAIEDGRAFVDTPDGASPAFGKYVAIHVKSDGKWLMSLVRDTRVEVASAHANVTDLDWLIGEWSAEERGASMTSVCRWVANKSFVERKYALTRPDGTTTAGVQIIGWNPQAGHVQSWNFSSDGGHAVGVWSPVESGWVAELIGTTGDGATTRAINRLTKLDDDAYAWQSTERSVAGAPLPDSEEIVMKRSSKDD